MPTSYKVRYRMPRIYLAARYTRHIELQTYALALEAHGYTITSRWIKGGHQITDDGLSAEGTAAQRVQFAVEDWEDLVNADISIHFTEKPRTGPTRGGRHVEYGIALARKQRVIVVGYRENIFHCLPVVEFCETWAECLQQLEKEAAVCRKDSSTSEQTTKTARAG